MQNTLSPPPHLSKIIASPSIRTEYNNDMTGSSGSYQNSTSIASNMMTDKNSVISPVLQHPYAGRDNSNSKVYMIEDSYNVTTMKEDSSNKV